jgi:ribosomal protein S18 acetylase RimI-like enzyme
MDFKFTNEYKLSKLDEIISYLLGPRLWVPHGDYPDFLDWADRTYKELKKEGKRAMIALYNNDIVGVSIYQKHKKYDDALEIKNLTVRPDQRGRYVASFLLRNTEIEGSNDFKTGYVLADAKAKNFQIKSFLLRNHYRILERDDLYQLGAGEDIIYKKEIGTLSIKRRESPYLFRQ